MLPATSARGLTKAGTNHGERPHQVMNHHHVPVTRMRAGTDAQRGNGGMHGNLAGRMRRHALHDHSAGTRLRHGFHILHQGFLLSGGFPFDFISAFLQHLLRQEADMPYHGNAGIHNGTYLSAWAAPPSSLTASAPAWNSLLADCTACSTVS